MELITVAAFSLFSILLCLLKHTRRRKTKTPVFTQTVKPNKKEPEYIRPHVPASPAYESAESAWESFAKPKLRWETRGETNETTEPRVWPFYNKKLLSTPEQILYFRLIRALPDHVILAQVQLSRFLGVKKGYNFNAWNNRINRLSADFVVCSKHGRVVAAIELDDATHSRHDRIEADARKDSALSSAAVPLIRWHVKSIPDHDSILSIFTATVHENLDRLSKPGANQSKRQYAN